MAEKAAKNKDAPYRINAKQLVEEFSSRPRIKTCLSLDVATGGGIPRGSTIVIGGKEGTGKSTLAFQMSANAQKIDNLVEVFLFPIEGRVTDTLFQQIRGLDEKRFHIIRPPIICNSNGEKIGHKNWSSQEWLNVIGKCVMDNPGCIIIIDSISQLVSEKERSEGVGVQDRGAGKVFESQFCRIYGTSVISQGITLFVLAQTIANTSGYGSPIMPKVGSGFKFMSDLTLVARSIDKWKAEGASEDDDGDVLGHNIKFKIEKNSFGPPWGTIVVPLRYGYGIDNIEDTILNAIDWGLIVKSGAWFYLPFAEVIKKSKKKDIEMESEIVPVNFIETEDEDIKTDLPEETEHTIVKRQGKTNVWKWFSENEKHYENLEAKIRSIIFNKESR